VIGRSDPAVDPAFGETWVYECLVAGIPDLRLTARRVIGTRFPLFEMLVVALLGHVAAVTVVSTTATLLLRTESL